MEAQAHQLVVTFRSKKQYTAEYPSLEAAREALRKVKDNPLLWNCAIYTAHGTFVEESANYGKSNVTL